MELKKSWYRIGIAVILFIVVVGSFPLFFFTKEKEKEIDVNRHDVQTAYQYVTYGREGLAPNFYLLEQDRVTLDSISDEMIHYYGFQALNTGEIKMATDESSLYQYAFEIKSEYYEKAIQTIFGRDIKYTRKGHYLWVPPVNYLKDNHTANIGSLDFQYNQEKKVYEGKKTVGLGAITFGLKPIYGKIEKATKLGNQIMIYERFVMVDVQSEAENQYHYRIYQDAKGKKLITEKKYVSATQLTELAKNISIDDYQKYSRIKYTFQKGDDNRYHFYESELLK